MADLRSPHPFSYARRRTREVSVGDVGVGGSSPIRIQSMTTPATTDVAATVAQIERLAAAGCEIVRVTVPSRADAESLPAIRKKLAALGIRVPLVADIHFTPAAALLAVEHVEKVRVNPGNYADRKRFETREYTDADYQAEIERIAEKFLPLVRRAKALGVAMRIGTNHGSLSDRILNRYGDTPLGMVESALEFVRIAAAEGYHALVLSMKSSNPLVAIEAYRLLVRQMEAEGMDYPLHLGVTEAGDGEDGRIKSAVGIGALLDEGIGDTIRVSLTEDPVAEIPVAFALAAPYNTRLGRAAGDLAASLVPRLKTVPAERPRGLGAGRRHSRAVRQGPYVLGARGLVRNEVRLRTPLVETDRLYHEIAAAAGVSLPAEKRAELLELVVTGDADVRAVVELKRLFDEHAVGVPLAVVLEPDLLARLEKEGALLAAVVRISGLPRSDQDEAAWTEVVRAAARAAREAGVAYLVEATPALVPRFMARSLPEPSFEGPVETVVRAVRVVRSERAEAIAACFTTAGPGATAAARLLVARLDAEGLDVPHLAVDRTPPSAGGGDLTARDPLLAPSVHVGGLLADGLADAIRIVGPGDAARDVRFGYDLLQAVRLRTVKAEFISCPSCGRTLFDLESTTARIKERTAHLKGVKIAIMGCVVNGPGEMADADFGYVGWGPGKVSLFVGKEMVEKDIASADADRRLVELIREHGKWVDPPAAG